MTSVLGGLFGAAAGSWIYDSFFRGGGSHWGESSAYGGTPTRRRQPTSPLPSNREPGISAMTPAAGPTSAMTAEVGPISATPAISAAVVIGAAAILAEEETGSEAVGQALPDGAFCQAEPDLRPTFNRSPVSAVGCETQGSGFRDHLTPVQPASWLPSPAW